MALRSIHSMVGVGILGGVLFLATSLSPADSGLYQSKTVGETLPIVKITNEVSQPKEASSAKRLSLIHFWAAYDAESRSMNATYDAFIKAGTSEAPLNYHAISVDIDEDIYKQTLALDGIIGSSTQQLSNPSEREQFIELFGLKEGLHSFLVDATGKILAIDPSLQVLEEQLKQI